MLHDRKYMCACRLRIIFEGFALHHKVDVYFYMSFSLSEIIINKKYFSRFKVNFGMCLSLLIKTISDLTVIVVYTKQKEQ